MTFRKILSPLFLLFILICGKGIGQNSTYLYHDGGVATPPTYEAPSGRPWKTSIDAGLVFGFAGTSGYYNYYVSGISANSGYTFGVIEEIPVQKRSYIQVGLEILKDGVSFNSYFFGPNTSFLYDGNFAYSHSISMNEIHVPVLYKFPIGPTDRKNRSVYMTAGWKWRYISYTYSQVTNNNTGYLVWSGERDVSTIYRILSPFGSSIFEVSIGYQRNTKKKKKRGWYANFEYNYGLSPLHYTGNTQGSNDVVFRLNTLIFKIGKIF